LPIIVKSPYHHHSIFAPLYESSSPSTNKIYPDPHKKQEKTAPSIHELTSSKMNTANGFRGKGMPNGQWLVWQKKKKSKLLLEQ